MDLPLQAVPTISVFLLICQTIRGFQEESVLGIPNKLATRNIPCRILFQQEHMTDGAFAELLYAAHNTRFGFASNEKIDPFEVNFALQCFQNWSISARPTVIYPRACEHPKGAALRLDSDIYTYEFQNNKLKLYEVYSLKGKTVETEMSLHLSKWERRDNLHGITLLGSSKDYFPMHIKNSDGSFVGYIADVVQALQKRLNFSLTMVEPSENR